jgi:hypothetical protein
MPPHPVWTVLAIVIGAGSALGVAVLGRICRRQRAALREAASRLDALAGRVARLEALEPFAGRWPAPSPPLTPTLSPEYRSEGSASRTMPTRTVRADAAASAVAGPTLIAVPNLAGGESQEVVATATAALGRRYGNLWELADAGVSAEAIARSTGQPIGQVELILGLRRPLAATGGPATAPGGEAIGP